MSDGTIQERLNAVRELIQMFRVERFVYLFTAILSLIVIFYFGVQLLSRQADSASIAAVTGSGGAITFGMSRLLVMWTQAMRLVAGQNIGD